ncbi:hypothetical protein LCGC14_2853140 [marine sediment metagenome]|uniref:Uncharacterized protein n=1 Tax=marine sediment metagenome TaxID=412755 RepID=A0A0F9AYS4_9ZZZZ|nr:hypothetical protein [Desulfobacterales bacterium]
MKNLDLGSLEWALSQSDLKLDLGFARTATGNERLDNAPIKAGFFWSRGTEQVYSIEVTKDELIALIQSLDSKGVKVPEEFNEALQEFPT